MKPLTTLLFLFYSLAGFCQKPADKIIVEIFENSDVEKIQIPFTAVHVQDVRFDQSNVGVARNKTFSKEGDAVFPTSLKDYFPKIMAKVAAFDSTAPGSLLVLIKKFRLIDQTTNEMANEFAPQIIFTISASFYAEKSGVYTKLFSINDVFRNRIDNYTFKDKERFSQSRSDAFVKLLAKLLSAKKWQALPNAPSFSWPEMEQGISKRFKIPALTDTVFRKGVYKSFEEFKNNTPSLTAVTFSYKKDKVDYIINDKNERLNPQDFWGACDGAKRFIAFKDMFHELITSDRGFKLYTYYTYADLHGSPSYISRSSTVGLLPAALYKAAENSRNYTYFSADMETGKIHLEEIFGDSDVKNIRKDILK